MVKSNSPDILRTLQYVVVTFIRYGGLDDDGIVAVTSVRSSTQYTATVLVDIPCHAAVGNPQSGKLYQGGLVVSGRYP